MLPLWSERRASIVSFTRRPQTTAGQPERPACWINPGRSWRSGHASPEIVLLATARGVGAVCPGDRPSATSGTPADDYRSCDA